MGTLVSVRAEQARAARKARAAGLVIDLVATSILLAILNNVYGVPGSGVPWAIPVLVWFAYVTVPEVLFGATFGKMLAGVCVVDTGGSPLSVNGVLIRNALRLVDALPFLYLLGGLVVLTTDRSQRVGDLLAHTTVVAREHATDPGATRRPPRGAGRMLGVLLVAALVFTVAFDYFGRPPLVVEGAYRTGDLQLSTYSLGAARWSLGEVTYELTGTKAGVSCTGYVVLDWSGVGWDMSGWSELCPGEAASP